MLDEQTILLTSAKWSLSRRFWRWRVLRFDPRPQRRHAVDDRLEGHGDFRHRSDGFPELVGVDRLIESAGADLLGSRIVGQQLDAHVAGGKSRRVDDKIIYPLFRVSLFGNSGDDDGLFWFDGHEFVWWVNGWLADVPSGAGAVYWNKNSAATAYCATENRSGCIVHKSTSTSASGGSGRKRGNSNRWHLNPRR